MACTNFDQNHCNYQPPSAPATHIITRLDSVMKQINRLNNIISIDDKFNYLYIKEVLKDSISSENQDHHPPSCQEEDPLEINSPVTDRRLENTSRIQNIDKTATYKPKIADNYEYPIKPKKKVHIQAKSQRVRTKTQEKFRGIQSSEAKARGSIKSPYQMNNNLNKGLFGNRKEGSKKKNTARGVNSSSHSQQSQGNNKKTLKRPASSKWIGVLKKPLTETLHIQKSQRTIKLNKMNLNKYKETVKKVETIKNKDLNGLDSKFHLNLQESKPYMQRLIEKSHNQEIYEEHTTKYMNVLRELSAPVIFKQLELNFNTNSDLLKALMIFVSQFSEKVSKQLADAFTKPNMQFDTLVKNSLKIALDLPLLLYKKNEVSESKLKQFMKMIEGIDRLGPTLLKGSLIALREYLCFLTRNHLVQLTQRSDVFQGIDDIDYYSQRNQSKKLEKMESPRQKSSKKCETQRKRVVGQQNVLGNIPNETKKKASKLLSKPPQPQSQQRSHKIKHSFDVLPKAPF